MDVSLYEFSCQKALHQGLQYARTLNHQLLEVEHVALALLRSDQVESVSESLDSLRIEVSRHLSNQPRVFGMVKIDFGQRLNRALDRAEAAAAGSLIGPDLLWEHLLRESTLLRNAVQRASKSEDVSGGIHETTVEDHSEPTPRAESERVEAKLSRKLKGFVVDLTAKAERGEIDPVVGRDHEVRRVLEILGRKKKNNPLLIGEPGVGKTAIAEGIALRIAEGRAPESIQQKRILSLDLGAVLAGAKFRGEFEDRLKGIIDAVTAAEGDIVLFVDEIHTLVGAGNHDGGLDGANLFKPALARGELQCLGATTIAEYRKYIEKDAALERRFQTLVVEEPDFQTTLSILRGIKARYEQHHGVEISDDALTEAVRLSTRYLSHRQLPDKAIDLVDEAASRLRLTIDSLPTVLEELRARIEQLEMEQNSLGRRAVEGMLARLKREASAVRDEYASIEGTWRHHQQLMRDLRALEDEREKLNQQKEAKSTQGDFEAVARIQFGEQPKLDQRLNDLKSQLEQLQSLHPFLRQYVGPDEIAEVVARRTKLPVSRLRQADTVHLRGLYERLRRRVYGQNEALRSVSRAVQRARLGISDPNRPHGVFLFLGPTGVGKTETAKALAEEVFGDETRLLRIDMSDFTEAHQVARLVGSPPGYIGYGEGGELTEPIRHHPHSVILLDEMEKAHPKVLDVLLPLFEEGQLTDGMGRTVNFRSTLLIMTSNLEVSLDGITSQDDRDHVLRRELSQVLRPEFVNRLDETVFFRPLAHRHLHAIIDRLLTGFNARIAEKGLRLLLSERLRHHLLTQADHQSFGGRAIRRIFRRMVVDAVADRLLAPHLLQDGLWTLDIDSEGNLLWLPGDVNQLYLPAAKLS